MNERIKLLVTQAANYANNYDDAGADIWFEMYNQKFAELLIRDFVWQVAKDDQVPQDIQVLIGNRVREQFGVEP